MAARLLLALVLAVSIWPFIGSTNAHACSPRPDAALERVGELLDSIFVGEVITVTEPDRDHRVHVFTVDRYVMGEGPHVLTLVGSTVCPNRMVEGGTYLVGAAGRVPIQLASPAKFASRTADAEELVMAQEGNLGSFSDEPIPPWATAISFGATILLGGALLLGVRRLASR